MRPKRILFLTTSVGSGHRRAGEAVQEALSEMCPGALNFHTETCFDYFSLPTGGIAAKTYVKTNQLMRQVVKSLYNQRRKTSESSSLKFFLNVPLVRKYEEAIRAFRPDVIVCTQALSCRFVSLLKAEGKILAPLMAVITDFDVHPYWFSKYADEFVVPTDEVKEEFIGHGIEAHKIHAFGIPIHPRFSRTQSTPDLKAGLGIRNGLPAILITGGGWGLGPIVKIVSHLNDSGAPLQLIVLTGENEILEKKLKEIASRSKMPMKIYGYVDNVDELMEVSDIAVTKPGGLTASELLAKGLPAVLIDVITGQEEANGDYLIRTGAACRVERISQLKNIIQRLLKNPSDLNRMRRNAKAAAKPFAAVDTAMLIMDTIYADAARSKACSEQKLLHEAFVETRV